ncbi:MAG: DUF4105 domain-containing protein [Gemmatimonadales bacterium]|nr:DUF4105 domain-containing protein [Gemmatimonadales bacterium]
MSWRAAVLLLAPLVAPHISAQTVSPSHAPEVYLVTMGPGETVYERYGHNAIWVRDTVDGTDIVYNYGTYDFGHSAAETARFVGRFAMGRPQYWLGTMTMGQTIEVYTHYKRDVELQQLALPAAKRIELAQLLATNALPENRVYTYDYFLDNCSTRVRDMLNRVLDGALQEATTGVPAEGSFRFHTHRSLTNDPPMYLGILLALGPAADAPLDQWGEMFLPAKLQERMRELRVPGEDGRELPLVAREVRLLEMGVYRVEAAPPTWGGWLLLVGSAAALLILTGRAEGPAGVAGRVAATVWLSLAGIGGMVLLFLWFATNHVASAWNHNLFFLTPLAFLMFGTVWSERKREAGGWGTRAAVLTIVLVGIGTVLAFFPNYGGQWNLQVAALVAPPAVASALLSLRRA